MKEIYSKDKTACAGVVNSVAGFLNLVKESNGEWLYGNLFRGQGNTEWPILSSLTRSITPSIKEIKEKYGDIELDSQRFDDIFKNESIKRRMGDKLNHIHSGYVNFKNLFRTILCSLSYDSCCYFGRNHCCQSK